MAFKAFLLFSFNFSVLLLLLSDVVSGRRNPTKASPLEFLEHLKGCHKGEKLKDIHKLKKYLHNFGYLSYSENTKNQSNANIKDDDFDDPLESALKTYQHNFHLNASGFLDSDTVSAMMTPRCGVADIINGTNWMQKKNHQNHRHHHHGFTHFHTVAHYSFFPQNPRWPSNKYSLTYGFESMPAQAIAPVERAFRTWAANTHFSFIRAQDDRNADLRIGFHRGNHGDGSPFDGRGGTLAHAFAPTDGRFHYDADEQWSLGAVPGAFDLETVALHEIGHLLGLGHSSVQGAIMFPSIPPGVTMGLNSDDIQGIRALYGV